MAAFTQPRKTPLQWKGQATSPGKKERADLLITWILYFTTRVAHRTALNSFAELLVYVMLYTPEASLHKCTSGLVAWHAASGSTSIIQALLLTAAKVAVFA